jgi:hypothetical protein
MMMWPCKFSFFREEKLSFGKKKFLSPLESSVCNLFLHFTRHTLPFLPVSFRDLLCAFPSLYFFVRPALCDKSMGKPHESSSIK